MSTYSLTEDRVTEDRVTEDRVTEDRVTEDRVTEDRVTEDRVTEDRVVTISFDDPALFGTARAIRLYLASEGHEVAPGLPVAWPGAPLTAALRGHVVGDAVTCEVTGGPVRVWLIELAPDAP